MMVRSIHRQENQQGKIVDLFCSVSKRTYAKATILYSAYGIFGRCSVEAMTITNPKRNRTTATTEIMSSSKSSLLSDIFSLGDRISSGNNNNVSKNLIWHHISEPIGSTQDETRRLLNQYRIRDNKAVAVLADIQLEGRGTQGRRWEMGDIAATEGDNDNRKDNNLYLTIAIPLNKIPITITLLPLQIGVFVAERVSHLITLCQRRSFNNNPMSDKSDENNQHFKLPKVTVKWPNDVLIDQKKVSGTLIETESVSYDDESTNSTHHTSWMLIGIGINVASAPRNLLTQNRPGKHKRPPCCIQDFCYTSYSETDGYRTVKLPTHTAAILGQDLSSAIADWVFTESTLSRKERDDHLLSQWRSYAEWGVQYELRGRVVDEEHGGYEGETVTTLDIEHDGQLRVRGANGRERLLVADYLF
jgi:BirA family transcriptional regulator, biotin operon repressor / biotin---[acetyl-CoA-carboxylase] ligase